LDPETFATPWLLSGDRHSSGPLPSTEAADG
jgi:hypothetical protein